MILLALLLTIYALLPLQNLLKEQQNHFNLITKQYEKTDYLLNNEEQLTALLKGAQDEIIKAESLFFTFESTDKFKLGAQSQIENLIGAGGCTIERFTFKGSTSLLAGTERWLIEIRFKGDINCVTHSTRILESNMPLVNIAQYSFAHSGVTKDVKGTFNVQLNLVIWYKEIGA